MHLDELSFPIGHDRDPVAGHPVGASPVPLQVLDMRGGVHELKPLRDPEQHRPAGAGEVQDVIPTWASVPTIWRARRVAPVEIKPSTFARLPPYSITRP